MMIEDNKNIGTGQKSFSCAGELSIIIFTSSRVLRDGNVGAIDFNTTS